jgi:hypothetical protein
MTTPIFTIVLLSNDTIITTKVFTSKKQIQSDLRALKNGISYNEHKANVAVVLSGVFEEINTSVINNNFVASIDSDEVQYLAERKEFYSKV